MLKKEKYSICIPIFANPGMLSFRTPNYKKIKFEDLKKIVLKCDKSKIDSIFIADHTYLGNKGEIFECTTLMSAFAAITKKINIGSIHLANNFRHPTIVAKIFSTLSHISKGRIILFYDYAWRESEFVQTGINFEKKNIRIKKMAEGLKIINESFKKTKVNFKGNFYKVTNFICNPKPLKKIPIWLGEADNKLMIEEIVRSADVFNSMPCTLKIYKKKLKKINKECIKQKRNFSTLGQSLETQILIGKNDKDLKIKIKKIINNKKLNKSYDNDLLSRLAVLNKGNINYENLEKLKEEFFVGNISEIRCKIDNFRNVGVDHFMFWPMDFPNNYTINQLINKIVN
mgnify:CR=1 FL=1